MYNRSVSQRTQVHQGSDRSTPQTTLAPVSAVLPMLKGTGLPKVTTEDMYWALPVGQALS